MKIWRFHTHPRPLVLAVVVGLLGLGIGLLVYRGPSASEGGVCSGTYADTLELAGAHIHQGEAGAKADYTYLVRSSAKYECPYFGPDGKLRRRRLSGVQHGSAFGYEVMGSETFLLTNEHVVDWPDVTDSSHRVDGIQDGCKRVELRLRIVRDDREDDDPAQVPLSLVATDPLLDAAILKAAQPLTIMPFRIGRAAALRQGNAVQVRGYPLGVMYAINAGKVVNTYDRDLDQGWDHVDFVIDALLSEGNSGSPVFALSCRTGNLELVGLYHAGYKGHSALNVVIAIEQLRDFMQKKKRTPRAMPDATATAFGPLSQARLRSDLQAGALPLIAFGDLAAAVEARDTGFRYHVYGRQFPLDDRRLAILDDDITKDGYPTVQKLWLRVPNAGLNVWQVKDLGPDEQDLVGRAAEALRLQIMRTFEFRAAAFAGATKSEARHHAREEQRLIERSGAANRELASALGELADRLAPAHDGAATAAGPRSNVDGGAPTPRPPMWRAPRAEE